MSYDLLSSVKAILRAQIATVPEPSILVAVSGGPDSVALLDVLSRLRTPLGLRLGVAHVDYRLRGEDSAEDALFVRDLARSYAVSIAIKELSKEESESLSLGGIPNKARRIRYRFFDEIAARDGFRLIALGHHRDDQLETFFTHLLRGAGTQGLAGMSILTGGRYLRPLLPMTHAQLVDYLTARCLPFRIDRSNLDPTFLRNRLRQRLIPAINEDYGPRAAEAVVRAMDVLTAEDDFVTRLGDREYSLIASRTSGREITLALDRLERLPLALKRRVVRRAFVEARQGMVPSFSTVEKLVWLTTKADSGARIDLGGGVVGRRIYRRLVIGTPDTRPETPSQVNVTIGSREEVPVWGVIVEADELPRGRVATFEPGVFYGDLDKIRLPLVIRRARQGDRIAPLGLDGRHKTVHRCLKDAKVPLDQRPRVLLLAERRRVLWIVGSLVSNDCRVGPSTRTVLRVRIVPSQTPTS